MTSLHICFVSLPWSNDICVCNGILLMCLISAQLQPVSLRMDLGGSTWMGDAHIKVTWTMGKGTGFGSYFHIPPLALTPQAVSLQFLLSHFSCPWLEEVVITLPVRVHSSPCDPNRREVAASGCVAGFFTTLRLPWSEGIVSGGFCLSRYV